MARPWADPGTRPNGSGRGHHGGRAEAATPSQASGGRAATDPKREAAARARLQALEQGFDGKRFVLVGDCNDNPDDRFINILEAGSPTAAGGPEEIEGPFRLNLCEALVPQDHASWGCRGSDVQNGRINTVRVGSRQNNNAQRGTVLTGASLLYRSPVAAS